MKNFIYTFTLILFSFHLFAQPVNDDCSGLIDFGEAPICPAPGIFNNVDATESNIGMDNFPPCFVSNPDRDVWFSFTAVPTISDYKITLTGVDDGMGTPSIVNPQLAIYRGDCAFDEMVLLECISAANGETSLEIVLTGLTPGLSYFLRINDWSASATPNSGAFQLCIEENIVTTFNMPGDSDACTGTLYDSGGPDGDYGNGEELTFTICPSEPHNCLLFTLNEYAIEDNFDELSFYDGMDTNAPLLGILEGLGSTGNNAVQQGVCYQVVATSGCLTVLMDSDNFVTAAGFVGQWECSNDCPDDPTLTVISGGDEADLAAGFTSPLMDVTVTNISCNNQAYGVFAATDDTNLGLNEGLLLTTGVAAEAANPASFFANNDLNLGGDPDLNFLNDTQGNGFNTDDACFVEMEVFVKTDQLGFDYVFGSEEYKQNFSQFSNDLIGILVSGPGIAGVPGLNGQENIAEIPTTGELIQIQSINANDNWEYYRDNNNSTSIAYNGLTTGFMGEPKALTAVRQVTPCQTYNVKLAIADIDQNDDSGFFVAPSAAGVPEVAVTFNTGIDYLVEGCTNISDLLTISLAYPAATDLTFNVQIGGTATINEDYLLNIPSQITIPAGETSLSYALTSIADLIPEGTETIEISLVADFGCGAINLSDFSIDLTEELVVEVNGGVDTVFVCAGINATELTATGAANYLWSPANLFDNATSATPIVTIMDSQTVTVTGSLGTCTTTETIFLQIIAPEVDIEIQNGDDDQLCQGESITLFANNNVSNTGLTWTPAVPNAGEPLNTVNPSFTTTYTATVETSGCTATDELTINVEPFAFPELTTLDTTICQNSSVTLGTSVLGSSTTFEWSPAEGLDDPTISNPTATPEETTTYTLTATSINGVCVETASVAIEVLPADVEIASENINICLGEEVTFSANTTTGGQGLVWTPADSLSSTTEATVTANPSVSTWYVATLNVGDCTVQDSVFVRVDSLPNLEITPIPFNMPFCEGEVISFTSPGYEDLDFPTISHQWTPSLGAQSTDTLLNFVVLATESTTFTRITSNNACADTSEITIEVIPTPLIEISPIDPVVCDGQSVQLEASSPNITEFEWSPSVGLSCTECPDPLATPPATITYAVTGEFMGCPANASVLVQVAQSPNLNLADGATICPGTDILLNTAAEDPTATYIWFDENNMILSNDYDYTTEELSETTVFTLQVYNGLCDTITETITINVSDEPTLMPSAEQDSICIGSPTVLSANTNSGGAINWFALNDEGFMSEETTVTVAPDNTETYYVEFTPDPNCGFGTLLDSVMVTVGEQFILEDISGPIMEFEGESVEICASISLDSAAFNPGMVVYSLFQGELIDETQDTCYTITLPEVDQDEVYAYSIVLTDQFNCVQSDTIQIIVKESIAEMPNAFTPNSDNSNDVFGLVKSPNVTVTSFRIYNRWGKEVYQLSDNPDGWDGTIDGEPASADVYFYHLEYEFAGEMRTVQGDVTLLR